jgi:hypothetical protein
MIPREILKKARLIEILTNRSVFESGNARLRRAVFGVSPKASCHKLLPARESPKPVTRRFWRDARTCTRDARAPQPASCNAS